MADDLSSKAYSRITILHYRITGIFPNHLAAVKLPSRFLSGCAFESLWSSSNAYYAYRSMTSLLLSSSSSSGGRGKVLGQNFPVVLDELAEPVVAN